MRNLFALGIVVLVIVLILAGPFLLIWSMNTLFPALSIPYDLQTWFAALIFGAVIGPRVRVTKR